MWQVPILYLTGKIRSFLRTPFMQRLKIRFPRVYAFVRNRFDSKEFRGLPLTIILFLVSINLAMLSELSEHVVNSPAVQHLDMEVSAWLFNLRTPFLSLLVYYFTLLGNVYGVSLFTILVSLLLLRYRRGFYVLALLISVLGSGWAMQVTKLYFQRERPLQIAYYAPDATYSFPSGHATSAMAVAGILCYIILVEIKDKQLRRILWLFCVLYVLMIGFSRIYLGVHFLTDVAAGYLLGLLWVTLGIGLMEYVAVKNQKR
jgi:membrane-associated phospholipid phosphatase